MITFIHFYLNTYRAPINIIILFTIYLKLIYEKNILTKILSKSVPLERLFVNILLVVLFYYSMVADLCHFLFSCLRPERRKQETSFLSLCRPSRFEAKTRRHDKGRQHERVLPADTKFSTKKFLCLSRLLK